jgi:membrane fusion protein (multidrug efflux system)
MSLKCLFLPPLALLLACGHHAPQDPAERKAVIAVAQPSRVREFERINVSGTLMPQGASSMVAFQVPGRALKVLFREGEPVRQGQVLAVLDAENLTHALEAAHAQVQAAKAGADQAGQECNRMQQLFASQSLAANDFAKFTAARDASREQLGQAVAGEAVARKNLSEATLVAPISGFIAKRLLEPGVMVGAGQPVFEIARMDPIEVNVGIPETDVRLVKVGQPAAVTIPAWPGRTFHGTVRVVNVSADPASRTYMARVSLPNPQRELKVGMVAEVSITGAQRLDLLMVPAEAIVRDPQGATLVFQYFPDQQRVYSKRVDVGGLYGRAIQVRSGLQGQEAIVVAGQNLLRNGMGAELAQERKQP